MYTVKELIEVLKECQEDYGITIDALGMTFGVETVSIDLAEKTVVLFGE